MTRRNEKILRGRKGHTTKLRRVQGTACIRITAACKTCPSAALNALLHLLPIDFSVISIAAQSAIRLKEVGLWRQSLKGHGSSIGQLTPYFSELRTDLSIRELEFEGRARAIFPNRQDWIEGKICTEACTSVFTDGSKMESGVGAGVSSKSANLSISFKLPNTASVFQAEVYDPAGLQNA